MKNSRRCHNCKHAFDAKTIKTFGGTLSILGCNLGRFQCVDDPTCYAYPSNAPQLPEADTVEAFDTAETFGAETFGPATQPSLVPSASAQ